MWMFRLWPTCRHRHWVREELEEKSCIKGYSERAFREGG